MGQQYFYTSNAVQTTLAASLGAVSAGSTGQTVQVASIAGWPAQFPAPMLLEWGTASQERVTLTQAATGTGPYTFANCIRGDDGTAAPAHNSGAGVWHGVTARDFFQTAPVFNVCAYGADPAGVADSTTAIQAAITAAHTAAAGGVVFLPPGTFKVSAALTIYAGLTLTGAGNGLSVIELAASAAVTNIIGLTATQFNYSLTISDLQINGNSGASATATNGIYLFAPSDCIIQRVRIVGVSGNAITLDGSGTYLGTATKVLDSFVRTCGGKGLSITQYATDTLVEGCDFGSCGGPAYYTAAIQVALVGSIGWGSDVGLSCDTTAGEIWISGCRFDQNLYYGIWVLCPNVTISSTFAYDNSAGISGTQPGILLDAGSGDVVISGCRSVGGLNSGPQQSYGIQLNSGRTGPAIITGCDVSGNGTGGINPVAIVAGDQFRGNYGFNPFTVAAPAFPGTTVTYTNSTGVDLYVYVTNGTAAMTTLVNGNTGPSLAASATAAIFIPASGTFKPTYASGSPSWVFQGN